MTLSPKPCWNIDSATKEREIEMTAKLERLLDEGLENLDQAKTTDQLRRRS